MVALDPRNARATAVPMTTVIGASGREWPILPPEFWPDEASVLITTGDEAQVKDGVRLVLGSSEAWDDFVAAGGTALMLLQHIQHEAGDAGGDVAVGESSGSATSSTGTGAEPASSNLPSPQPTAA